MITLDGALIGFDRCHRAAAGAHAGDTDAGSDPHTFGLCLGGQSAQRSDVVGVAALLFVQDRGDAGRLPVIERLEHVGAAVALALDEHRWVADRLLLGEDLRHVLMHDLRRDLHVADRVVGERFGI